MSIATELTLLANSKQAIKNSINQKGGNITDSTPLADYSTAIDNLPSGGSGNPLLTSIDVSDFTGTTFNQATSYITDVTIPSGVTDIGNNAFTDCTSLTSVTIPSGVTNIGNYAFYGCSSLTSINIPSGVTSIRNYTFTSCARLTSITIPSSVTSIGDYAFQSIGNYQQLPIVLTLPNTLTTIGRQSFQGIERLERIVIPSAVTSIGLLAFIGCTRLNYIVSEATTPPTLGSGAFDNTNNCPIYVPAESVDTYKAESGWSTYASRIVGIEDAVRLTPTNGDPAISVKNYELASTGYIQSTDVPSTIKNGAGSLEICEGVTRIGQSAFQNGTSLTSVTLPSTLTRMDETVFDNCTGLTSVTVNATTPPTIYAAVFNNTNNCPIYVPAESVDAYKAATNWSRYASRIQAIPS